MTRMAGTGILFGTCHVRDTRPSTIAARSARRERTPAAALRWLFALRRLPAADGVHRRRLSQAGPNSSSSLPPRSPTPLPRSAPALARSTARR